MKSRQVQRKKEPFKWIVGDLGWVLGLVITHSEVC